MPMRYLIRLYQRCFVYFCVVFSARQLFESDTWWVMVVDGNLAAYQASLKLRTRLLHILELRIVANDQ